MKVELIYDEGCPNVPMAREHLLQALALAGKDSKWTEWDRAAALAPDYTRRYGSPTILVEGMDVVSEDAVTSASCCRLYPDSSGAKGRAPAVEKILQALGGIGSTGQSPKPPKASWRAVLASALAVGVALVPNLTCAACWPAYAGLLTSLGVSVFDYTPYLMPLTGVALVATLVSLAWRAQSRRGYRPLAVGVVGSLVEVAGKFVIRSEPLSYAGVALLVATAVWNVWPRGAAKTSRPCNYRGCT